MIYCVPPVGAQVVIPPGLFAAEMEANSRVMVHVLLLALALQVSLSQHWSYGWLPGGKRSVGELEATIRVGVALLLYRRSQSWG